MKARLRIESLEPRYALSGNAIIQDDFETGQPSADWSSVHNPDGGDGVVSGVAHTGNYSYRIRYDRDEDIGLLELYDLPRGDEYYVRFWQMYPDGFLQRNLKQAHFFHESGSSYQGSTMLALWGDIDGNLDPNGVQAATTFYGGFGSGGEVSSDYSSFPIHAGEWYKTAFYMKFNTPGLANGIYKLWHNDTLIVDLNNVSYRTTDEVPDGVWIGGNYSGGGQAPVPFDRYIDDIFIARHPSDDMPTVVSVTPSPALITDVAVGSGTFTVQVVYSEPMNTAISPTITFDPNVASILSFASGAWSVGNSIYTATYNVAEMNVRVVDVDILVRGARGAAGNMQTPATQVGAFGIDGWGWHNPVHFADVDGNGKVEPLDSLIIISHLRNHGSHDLPVPRPPSTEPRYYLDTADNNRVEPLDALIVISYLRNLSTGGEGEAAQPAGEGEAWTSAAKGEAPADIRDRSIKARMAAAALQRAPKPFSSADLASGYGGSETPVREILPWQRRESFVTAWSEDGWRRDKWPASMPLAAAAFGELEGVLSELAADIEQAWETGRKW